MNNVIPIRPEVESIDPFKSLKDNLNKLSELNKKLRKMLDELEEAVK